MTAQQAPGRTLDRRSLRWILLLLGGVVLVLLLPQAGIQDPLDAWDTLFINPIANALIILSNLAFGNFGVAIILFTLVMRLVTMPLTLRQLRSSRALTALQPQMQELQKKYKDPRRRQEETMKLYREAGVNPMGCLLPMLVQFPIWIALYRALIFTVGGTPESLTSLSQRLYPWSYIESAVPLQNQFLGLHLGQIGGAQGLAGMALALVVGLSTYVQQRMMTAPTTDPRQQSMNQMMSWMMPLMFGWFTLQVPGGLGLYWAVSNITGVFLNFFVYRPGEINWRQLLPMAAAPSGPERPPKPAREEPASEEEPQAPELAAPVASKRRKRSRHGRGRGKRKNR
jgi:YidC/Oxa1 family membrane protein insertase